jgi:hypothetical protein
MADVLSVIADIIKQDKIQKREHAKVMREVQKKLKEKEVDTTEDNADFMGAASQAAADGKKEFEFPPGSGKMYPVTIKDKDTAKKIAKKMDDEDEQEEETSLGDRVKARMKEEEENDSDEEENDSDEEENDSDEPSDEPSEEQIDKIADLVLQKIRDKADEEEDEEEEPETTEAESGKKEKIDMNPKVESIDRNLSRRAVWEEAIRKVYEEKVPEPIPVIIKSVGKELRDYALKSGGIDRDDFLSVSKTMLQGKMPNARSINNMDTDPREFILDMMAKTFGWKYTEQYSGVRFQRRHDYVESFQGGYKLQEHCGECGAMDHVDEKFKKGKYTVRDGNTGKVIATYSSGEKASKEMHKLLDSGKYTDLEVKLEEVEIDEKMDGRKKFSGKQAKKDNEDRRAAQRKKLGILGPNEEVEVDEAKGEFEVKYASSKKGPIKVSKFNTLDDAKKFLAQVKGEGMNGIISKGGKPVKEEVELDEHCGECGAMDHIDEKKSDYEDQIKAYLAKGGKIQKGDKPNKRKIDMVTKGFMKKFGAMKKKEADLDAKDKEELEKMMGEAVIQETWLDDDAKKVQSKWKRMDKKAKKKWMDGVMAKAKKDKMPKDEVMDVLDDYGLVEEVSNLQRLEDWGISVKKEGYMVLPAIDREKYTPMRGMEGPFPTFSGKVLYYDPKAGMYYDRDSDIYLSYDAYLEYDKISPSQQKQMDLGPLGDPKSKEYKAMERIKKKAAKMAKKDQLKNESIGMRFVRKHYRKDKDSI